MEILDATQTNLVFLRGRLAAGVDDRTLPSGDVITGFRLTVDRPAGEPGKVDSLDCATVRSRVRRTLQRATPGDVIEVEGSLRRRFWRGPAGLASRYEVRVETARLVNSGRRNGAAAGRTPASE
jgi:single-strand DNA-binding protein